MLTTLAMITPIRPMIRKRAELRQVALGRVAVKAHRAEHGRRDEEGAGDRRAGEDKEDRGQRQAHDRAEGPEQGLRRGPDMVSMRKEGTARRPAAPASPPTAAGVQKIGT